MYFDLDKPVKVKMFGKYTQKQGFWHDGRCLRENVFLHLIDRKFDMKIDEIFARVTKLNIWRNNAEKLLLDSITRELIIVLSMLLADEQPTNHTLQKILLYVNKHYAEPITLTSISEKFEISTSYTLKLFKKHFGVGTVDYINNLRLSRACEYLMSSDYTIGEISDKVGFANQYYFDRLFRKKYGMTPTKFRKSNYMMRP